MFVADVRKASITPIGSYVVSLVDQHLRSEDLATDTFGPLDPGDVRLAKTASRSILGVMNDAAVHARYRIEAMGGIDRSDTFFQSLSPSGAPQPRRRIRHSARPRRAAAIRR